MISKGKKRIGFDYKLSLEYDVKGAKGIIKLKEVTDYSEGKFEVKMIIIVV